uniref:Uncharacterized protein n=1 Tax=Podoviridae sp. ct8Lf7 TaxID=2827723 RepID=A0A8S5S1D7_9CAUD|nr:MAG TPA: hypothetical protein [Podoviridae sp. ct8Lf7]
MNLTKFYQCGFKNLSGRHFIVSYKSIINLQIHRNMYPF